MKQCRCVYGELGDHLQKIQILTFKEKPLTSKIRRQHITDYCNFRMPYLKIYHPSCNSIMRNTHSPKYRLELCKKSPISYKIYWQRPITHTATMKLSPHSMASRQFHKYRVIKRQSTNSCSQRSILKIGNWRRWHVIIQLQQSEDLFKSLQELPIWS